MPAPDDFSSLRERKKEARKHDISRVRRLARDALAKLAHKQCTKKVSLRASFPRFYFVQKYRAKSPQRAALQALNRHAVLLPGGLGTSKIAIAYSVGTNLVRQDYRRNFSHLNRVAWAGTGF